MYIYVYVQYVAMQTGRLVGTGEGREACQVVCMCTHIRTGQSSVAV